MSSGSEKPRESVYNFLTKEEVHAAKPLRYTSKFRATVVEERKTNKCSMKTMGPAKVDAPSPDKYLKKHSKEAKLPEKRPYTRICAVCGMRLSDPPATHEGELKPE